MNQVTFENHPAVMAWAKLRPRPQVPRIIGTLQSDSDQAVYRLEGLGPTGSAIIAKWCRRATAELERSIYQEILARASIPTLHYYGLVEEPGEFCWAFLEDAGEEGYSPVVEEHRALGARWLGAMHVGAVSAAAKCCLPDRGPRFYLQHLREARATILRSLCNSSHRAEDVVILKALVAHCDSLELQWNEVEEFCNSMPQTLVHGDFDEKNVRVRGTSGRLALLAFDWDMAGWGAPGADLAGCANISQPSLGGCADIRLYWSVVRAAWPHLRLGDIQHLANYGGIFRILATINWDSWMLDNEDEIGGYLRMSKIYEAWLANSIQAMERT